MSPAVRAEGAATSFFPRVFIFVNDPPTPALIFEAWNLANDIDSKGLRDVVVMPTPRRLVAESGLTRLPSSLLFIAWTLAAAVFGREPLIDGRVFVTVMPELSEDDCTPVVGLGFLDRDSEPTCDRLGVDALKELQLILLTPASGRTITDLFSIFLFFWQRLPPFRADQMPASWVRGVHSHRFPYPQRSCLLQNH